MLQFIDSAEAFSQNDLKKETLLCIKSVYCGFKLIGHSNRNSASTFLTCCFHLKILW
uniref:Uncharacterized protein n=1 Tax=Anguilla anguilla TaxID=7936 RepID=A0A0E9PPR5_ANGAN